MRTDTADLPAARAALAADRAPPRRWLALVNPAAGHHPPRRLAALCRHIEGALGAEAILTRSAAEIAELLRDRRGADGVAVFGGDGTLAEAVNQMQLDRQALLVLPGGTGNGLARDLGVLSLGRALAAQRAGQLQAIDLLAVSAATGVGLVERLVISTASLGYAADTVALARRLPRALSALRYTAASIIQSARAPARAIEVAIDGGPPQRLRVTNLMFNNTRHAGNFSIFRGASLRDGQLDMLIAANGCRQQVLYNLGLLSHTYLWPAGRELRARTLWLRPERPLRLMLDGELWEGVTELDVHVLPGALACYGWAERGGR